MFIKIIQNDFWVRITFELDNYPHTGAIGFVRDVTNTINFLFADKLGHSVLYVGLHLSAPLAETRIPEG